MAQVSVPRAPGDGGGLVFLQLEMRSGSKASPLQRYLPESGYRPACARWPVPCCRVWFPILVKGARSKCSGGC